MNKDEQHLSCTEANISKHFLNHETLWSLWPILLSLRINESYCHCHGWNESPISSQLQKFASWSQRKGFTNSSLVSQSPFAIASLRQDNSTDGKRILGPFHHWPSGSCRTSLDSLNHTTPWAACAGVFKPNIRACFSSCIGVISFRCNARSG